MTFDLRTICKPSAAPCPIPGHKCLDPTQDRCNISTYTCCPSCDPYPAPKPCPCPVPKPCPCPVPKPCPCPAPKPCDPPTKVCEVNKCIGLDLNKYGISNVNDLITRLLSQTNFNIQRYGGNVSQALQTFLEDSNNIKPHKGDSKDLLFYPNLYLGDVLANTPQQIKAEFSRVLGFSELDLITYLKGAGDLFNLKKLQFSFWKTIKRMCSIKISENHKLVYLDFVITYQLVTFFERERDRSPNPMKFEQERISLLLGVREFVWELIKPHLMFLGRFGVAMKDFINKEMVSTGITSSGWETELDLYCKTVDSSLGYFMGYSQHKNLNLGCCVKKCDAKLRLLSIKNMSDFLRKDRPTSVGYCIEQCKKITYDETVPIYMYRASVQVVLGIEDSIPDIALSVLQSLIKRSKTENNETDQNFTEPNVPTAFEIENLKNLAIQVHELDQHSPVTIRWLSSIVTNTLTTAFPTSMILICMFSCVKKHSGIVLVFAGLASVLISFLPAFNSDELIVEPLPETPSSECSFSLDKLLTCTGVQIYLSNIMENVRQHNDFKEIHIFAVESVVFDQDLARFHGKNVAVFAPHWTIMQNCVIDLSGSPSKPPKLPGESSGHFYGVLQTVSGGVLQIIVNGGKGGVAENIGIFGRNDLNFDLHDIEEEEIVPPKPISIDYYSIGSRYLQFIKEYPPVKSFAANYVASLLFESAAKHAVSGSALCFKNVQDTDYCIKSDGLLLSATPPNCGPLSSVEDFARNQDIVKVMGEFFTEQDIKLCS